MAERGRGAVARGSGRANRGGAPRGGNNNVPLAAQMRQMLRLEEPKEMATLRRYKDIGATRVQSVYGQTGLLSQEVFVPAHVARDMGYEDVPAVGQYISLLDAEEAIAASKQQAERERALARRATRLPADRSTVDWVGLTQEERRVLLLSQKEYNSFRASQGGNTGAAVAAPTTTAAQTAQAAAVPEN
jgi:hypothetical protein